MIVMLFYSGYFYLYLTRFKLKHTHITHYTYHTHTHTKMEENQQNTNDKKEISVLEKRTNTIKKTILICDKIICALRYAYAHKFPGNVYKDLDKEKIMLKSHHMRYNQKENRTTKNKKEMFEKAYI